MTNILALDLGTKTGYSIHLGNEVISGTINLSKKKNTSVVGRFLEFQEFLKSMQDNNIDVIYFEDVKRHLGTYAAHFYGGLMALLRIYCSKKQIRLEGVGVGTIKKFISGKGNASKTEVIEATKGYGFSPKDDNEADAIAIMLYACVENNLIISK